MYIVCSDLESIYVGEIWVSLAEKTGIKELRKTTRDEPDYNKLMASRISILKEHNLKFKDIQEVLAKEEPLPGARNFIDWLRSVVGLAVVSDTFIQFADPWVEKLGRPLLFCNSLIIDSEGFIAKHNMRQENGKQKVVEAFKSINYQVIAIGDSYNDINMLKVSQKGILFCPPNNVKNEFPEFPVANNYNELKNVLKKYLEIE